MDRLQHPGAHEWSGGHAEERQRTDGAKRPSSGRTTVQVRGGRRRHGHERTATDRLHEPGRDQLAQGRGPAGEHRAHHEHHERPEEDPPDAVAVGQLARRAASPRWRRAGSR